MKSWFARIVVTIAAINLTFFALPSLYVIFGGDTGISSLLDQGASLHIALWIHRVSVISVVAVAVALFLLLTKIRFGNSVAALVLAAFVVQMSYFAFVSEAPTSGGPMPRLEYNDEEFGRKYENIAKYVMIVLEVLLVGILLGSKRIRKAYGH